MYKHLNIEIKKIDPFHLVVRSLLSQVKRIVRHRICVNVSHRCTVYSCIYTDIIFACHLHTYKDTYTGPFTTHKAESKYLEHNGDKQKTVLIHRIRMLYVKYNDTEWLRRVCKMDVFSVHSILKEKAMCLMLAARFWIVG